MLSLDLKKPLLHVDGTTLKNETGKELEIAFELANVLAVSRSGNPIKIWGWATTLASSGVIQLDDADIDELKRVIEQSDTTALFKGQVLREITLAVQRRDSKPAAA